MDRSSTHSPDALLDRRSGVDRRQDLPAAGPDGSGPEPTSEFGSGIIARWPVIVAPGFEDSHPRDPWATVVHRSIADYRAGRTDAARQVWDERIVWRIDSRDAAAGPEAVFERHRRLAELTDDTFRQTLVSLEGSGGPIVEAHVRTTARRDDRTLDVPSLIVFELAAMRIRQVTEIPGDQAAWDAFWAD
jgi:ketosteroid isomerase-like protein